jgi:hypothetical protein
VPRHFACQFSLLFKFLDSCRGHDSATRFLVTSHHLSRLKGQRLEGELLRHCPYDTSVRVEVNLSIALDLAPHPLATFTTFLLRANLPPANSASTNEAHYAVLSRTDAQCTM